MPITPFHFGPAALAKSLTSKYFSFVTFALSQVIIDAEPLYYMSQGLWPIHRFFHTYLGATVVAVLVILFGKPVCEAVLRLWNWRLSEAQRSWLGVNAKISFTTAAVGALFGAYSHVLFDSIMHSDMQPFAPFSDGNPLLYVISIDRLHDICVLLGILGGLLLLILSLRRKFLTQRNE